MQNLFLNNSEKRFSIIFRTTGKQPFEFYFNDRSGLYLHKVDLKKKTFINSVTEKGEYDKSKLPTINELIAAGKMEKEFAPYREYAITVPGFNSCREFDDKDFVPNVSIESIVQEFKKHDFDVPAQAIRHNFHAWLSDRKSGYRCGGCHIFTPCGCNPLEFTATELYPACSDWQVTY